jgi:hypothetical protein
MPLKPILVSLTAAVAAALILTGCSVNTAAPEKTPEATSEATPSASADTFILDGVYEFAFSEKSFATADGGETLPATAAGIIEFKNGECAVDMVGKDVMGNEIRIVKPLNANGHVWDSVSRSWTEMGSPYIPSLVSANPSAIAFNRAAGNSFSFCAIADFGKIFEISAENPALYVASPESSEAWILANVTKYAEGLVAAAMLPDTEKAAAIAKIIAANTFAGLPETRMYAYDLAGLITIEDATETSSFKIDLIRQDEKLAKGFKPALPKDASVTKISDLAAGYIQGLK